MPVCGLSISNSHTPPLPEGDMELPFHLFPVIIYMINLITSFLSGTVRASHYRYQHFMSYKNALRKKEGASPAPHRCTFLLSTDAGFDTCICQAVSTAKYLFALFAPRPPSRELSGWLTVISSMGISPVRVSCRPTAGSIIVTWCASSPYREQPCIWGWSDRSPTLEEFHTLKFFSVFLSGRIMADRLYGSSHRCVSG